MAKHIGADGEPLVRYGPVQKEGEAERESEGEKPANNVDCKPLNGPQYKYHWLPAFYFLHPSSGSNIPLRDGFFDATVSSGVRVRVERYIAHGSSLTPPLPSPVCLVATSCAK